MTDYLPLWVFLVFCMITVARSMDGGNSKHLVTNLPGQPKVSFNHYSGYVTVNEKNGSALFYWFFEAATLKEKRPLVLWLNGGPGCSSVGYGATQEIGPFIVNENGIGLSFNEFAWNNEANLLFLESPVGVGFSYSNKSSDYKMLGDTITAEDSYTFLQNWFRIYPQYKTHELYLTGESYAGKYVPELAELIYDRNKISSKSRYINLRGFMVGNPLTHEANDWQGQMDYAWSHAVVSDETHRIIVENCDFGSPNRWDNENCSDAVGDVLDQLDKIDMYSLYTPKCIHTNTSKNAKRGNQFKYSTNNKFFRMLSGYDPCLDDYAQVYYNRYDVQKALHVINGSHLRNWSICNHDIFNTWNWSDSRASVLPAYLKLINAGLRIWVYSGDTDGRVPVLSTRYNLNELQLPKGPWRPWYYQGQVGGWTQEYEGLTYATFRGAGHAVPIFNRGEALAFFSSFLSGTALPNGGQ